MFRSAFSAFCAAWLLVSPAQAQTLSPPAGGGGGAPTTIANGTTFTGGTDKQVCFNDGGTLSCGDAGLTYDKTPGQLTMSGKTVTTSNPILNLSQTWNAGAVTFTGIKANFVSSASAANSLVIDLQVGGVSQFNVSKIGNAAVLGNMQVGSTSGYLINAGGLVERLDTSGAKLSLGAVFGWGSGADPGGGTASLDTILSRSAAAAVQLGLADAAAPVAQGLRVQSVVAGTADTAGTNWTLRGSLSTGSGASGDIIFQTGGTGEGSTAQNTATTALTIKGATQLVTLPAIVTDATHTDSTLCQDTTTHAIYFGSGAAGICLGTSSVRFKTDLAPLTAGLDELLRVDTVSYRYRPGYGDPSRRLYGFTAEQMAGVMPELVGLDADGRPNSVDWAGMVPVLVRAIQQQQVRIETLEGKIR